MPNDEAADLKAIFAYGATAIGLGLGLYFWFPNTILGWVGLLLSFAGLTYWICELLGTPFIVRYVPEGMIRMVAATMISAAAVGYGWPRLAYPPLPGLNANFAPPRVPDEATPPAQPISPPISASMQNIPIQTYLSFDGPLRFPQNPGTGLNAGSPETDLVVGQELFFNYWFKVHGPNPIQIFAGSQGVYLEPNADDATQRLATDEFRQLIKNNWKKNPQYANSYQLSRESDNSHTFNSAHVITEDHRSRILTQKDLDDLTAGKIVAFVVVEVPYKDNGRWHHLRTCQFPQPPAKVPVIWHLCNYFINSD